MTKQKAPAPYGYVPVHFFLGKYNAKVYIDITDLKEMKKMKGKFNPGVHSVLLAAVGGYILYIAWNLFDKYRNQAGEMPPALNIVAIVVMTLGGLGTLYYAWTVYRQDRKNEEENTREEEQDKI